MQSVITPMVTGMVMPLAGGGFMAARQQPPAGWLVQRHGPDGQPLEPEVTVPAPVDASAGIAPLAGGGYAVLWLEQLEFQRFGGSIYQLWTRSFAADGAPVGAPLRVAQTIPALYWIPRPLAFPQLSALAGGGYAMVWVQSNGAGGLEIRVRRFDADGAPAGAEQHAAPQGSGYLRVCGLAGGGYLAAWGTFAAAQGAVRAWGPDDAQLGPAQAAGPSWSDFPVNGGEPPAIAPLTGGGAVIVWLRDRSPYVRVQQLAPDARPIGAERIVDDSTPAAPEHDSPAVAPLPDGGYVVAWIESGEVHARRFRADGAPAGDETRIDLLTSAAQGPLAVVGMAAGGFLVCWSALGADGVRRSDARLLSADALLAKP